MQAARRDDRHVARVRHRGNEAHGRGLFPAVVASRFKALRHHRIHASGLGLQGKLHAADHVDHFDAVFVQMSCPRLGVACAGEHDGHAEFHNALHVLLHSGVQERHIDGKRFARGGGLKLLDLVSQDFRVHAACAQNAKSPGSAHGAGQFPTAAPHHARLDDWHLDAQQIANPVARLHASKVAVLPRHVNPWRSNQSPNTVNDHMWRHLSGSRPCLNDNSVAVRASPFIPRVSFNT